MVIFLSYTPPCASYAFHDETGVYRRTKHITMVRKSMLNFQLQHMELGDLLERSNLIDSILVTL